MVLDRASESQIPQGQFGVSQNGVVSFNATSSAVHRAFARAILVKVALFMLLKKEKVHNTVV